MKLKLLIATLLTAAMSTAFADTYVVGSDNGSSNDTPKLKAAHGAAGACVYGDKSVKLGDTLIMDGSDIVMVCASGPRGAVFHLLSHDAAQRVVAAVPAQAK